jgi:hypothetical protein
MPPSWACCRWAPLALPAGSMLHGLTAHLWPAVCAPATGSLPHPLLPQFALEALTVPAEQPTSPAEVARLLPPAIKLLRTLKFCDDACSEPRTEVGWEQGSLGWCAAEVGGGGGAAGRRGAW